MRKTGKILLFIGFSFMLLNAITWGVISFTGLRLKYEIPISVNFGIAMLIVVLAFGLIKKRKIWYLIVSCVIFSLAYFFVLFISAIVFWDMCDETISAPVYFNKFDNKQKIVIRDFGCGATDSTPNSISCCLYSEVGLIFYKLTPVDTTMLDKNSWIWCGQE